MILTRLPTIFIGFKQFYIPTIFSFMNKEIVSHWHAGWDENMCFQVEELRFLLIAVGASYLRVLEGLISWQTVDGNKLQ